MCFFASAGRVLRRLPSMLHCKHHPLRRHSLVRDLRKDRLTRDDLNAQDLSTSAYPGLEPKLTPENLHAMFVTHGAWLEKEVAKSLNGVG